MELSTATPQQIDTELARLSVELFKARSLRDAAMQSMHSTVGDREIGRGRGKHWQMSDGDVIAAMRAWLASGEYFAPAKQAMRYTITQGQRTMDRFAEQMNKIDEIRAQMRPLDAEYDRRPWSRFFLCTANNGHIHSSTSCHTLYITSQLAWNPELSGLSETEAVAKLGPILCTVCFPSAPVEWTRDPKDIKAEAEQGLYCEGGRPKDADMRKRSPYGTCPSCGEKVSVTSTGKTRKHKAQK